ncbi:hypothetical protein [Kutzneria kofuensis]|uniref:Uncharacterized protein n=1 Tax=Kutzneria kofuensis TaxID=103725 RepID=A0A7W9KQG3_9PSEU|nr:hypothetical protein [Kutzneria kofuensis]
MTVGQVVAVIDQLPCSIATVHWAADRAAVDGPPLLVLLTQSGVRSPVLLAPWLTAALPWPTDPDGERAEIFHEVAAQLAASGLPWDFRVMGEAEPLRPGHDTVIAFPEHRRGHQWLSPRPVAPPVRRLLVASARLVTVRCAQPRRGRGL